MPDGSGTSGGTAVAPRPSPVPGTVARYSPLRLARRHPRLTTTLLVWVLGLYCAFLARPLAITEQQAAEFRVKMKEAEVVLGELTHAERQLMEAELEQRQYQVWFWRWKPEARREVEARRPAVQAAQERVRVVQGERNRVLREAKSVLGLWSEAGVEEGREVFWQSFASGKVFAQRQSFLDGVFTILGGRDRDWLSLLLQLLFQTLINFFTGMCVSVFVFLFKLPGLIWSYQPALWSGLAFFSLAAVAAVSVVAGYLGLLFGAGATAAYATVSLAAQQQQRLEATAQQQQRRRIAHAREHHE